MWSKSFRYSSKVIQRWEPELEVTIGPASAGIRSGSAAPFSPGKERTAAAGHVHSLPAGCWTRSLSRSRIIGAGSRGGSSSSGGGGGRRGREGILPAASPAVAGPLPASSSMARWRKPHGFDFTRREPVGQCAEMRSVDGWMSFVFWWEASERGSRDAAVWWMAACPALLLDVRPPMVANGAVHYIISAFEATSCNSWWEKEPPLLLLLGVTWCRPTSGCSSERFPRLFLVLLQKEALLLFLYATQFFWNGTILRPRVVLRRVWKPGQSHHDTTFKATVISFPSSVGIESRKPLLNHWQHARIRLISEANKPNGNHLPQLERRQILLIW